MNELISSAASNMHDAFCRAHDRLEQAFVPKDLLRKSGPPHRHRKHGWDFNTLGATYCIRHARRYENAGQTGVGLALRAAAVPLGALACTLVGIIPKVAMATAKWSWYYGYENPQGEDSLRKDFVQAELQEATANLQMLGTYADEHPAQRANLRPYWSDARNDVREFRDHLSEFSPKIGGSYRLHKVLKDCITLVDAHDPPARP